MSEAESDGRSRENRLPNKLPSSSITEPVRDDIEEEGENKEELLFECLDPIFSSHKNILSMMADEGRDGVEEDGDRQELLMTFSKPVIFCSCESSAETGNLSSQIPESSALLW